MIRDGIEYERMQEFDLSLITTVKTPFKTVSKLELTRDLIEQIHQEAIDRGAGRVWLGELAFQSLDGELGIQAYAYVSFQP